MPFVLFGSIIAIQNWRVLFLSIMVWMVYEGALRKWGFPAYQGLIYLIKDMMLMLVYIGFVLNPPKQFLKFPFANAIKFWMISCVIYYSMLLFNPNSPSVLLSILGLKNYIFYFPVAFLVPYCIRDMAHFERLFKLYMILVLPALLISFVQFSLPSTHFLNRYVNHQIGTEAITSQFGSGSNRVRTAGMFSYLSGNFAFNLFMMISSLCLLTSKKFVIKGNLLTFLVLILAIGGLFTTGSRSGLLAMILSIITILGTCLIRGLISPKIFMRLIMASLFAGIFTTYLSSDAIIDLFNRTTSVNDTTQRLLSPFIETRDAFKIAPLGGTGLASTHGGLIRMTIGNNHTFEWLGGATFEIEPARVMLETGLAGFLLFFGLKFANIIIGLRILLASRLVINSVFAAGFFCWFSIHLVLFIVTHPTAALYYYFALGILFVAYFTEINFHRQFAPQKPKIPPLNTHPKNKTVDV